MAKRDRLGKGLGALLGEYLEVSPDEGTLTRSLPVASIAPNPFQPRREFSDEELADLAGSIEVNGLLQPIMVRPSPGGVSPAWQLVAGERRWRAVMRIGWRDVPAVVRDVDDRTLLVLALVENLQRSELSAIDEAAGFRQLAEEFGLTQQEIAEAVGRDRSTIANTLRLLQLPAGVIRMIREGRLSAGHARALLALPDERRMLEVGRRAAEEGWSVREVEARAQRRRSPRPPAPVGPERARSVAERRLEEELQRALGTRVTIRRERGGKGRIEVPFYGAEDFERLFEALTRTSVADIV